jgi:mannose-6-phosphate isomerase-like protein (cupin superfamily)
MTGSIIISPTGTPSRIVGSPGAADIGEWKRLAWGRVLHSDLDAFEWHRLPAGATINEHNHTLTEEIYFILAGQAEMRLGDEWRRIDAGELVATPLNSRHAIANVGDDDLDFLVMEVVPPAIRERLPRHRPVTTAGAS